MWNKFSTHIEIFPLFPRRELVSKVMLIIIEYCILVNTPPPFHLDKYVLGDQEKIKEKIILDCMKEGLSMSCPYPKDSCQWL